MISIHDEQRVDVLRKMALLLEQENRRLHQRIQRLTAELARFTTPEGVVMQSSSWMVTARNPA